MSAFILVFLAALVVLGGIAVGVFYVVLGMANSNFLFTKVEEGWYKVVMKLGKYHKTLEPGLHWLGWPGVSTLYSRKMSFKKCKLEDSGAFKVDPHDDPNVSSFKSTVYPYAIPFENEEDSHGLPLTGVAVLHGRMTDLRKAFFVASDWYLTMISLSTPVLQWVITTVSFEKITGQATEEADARAIAKKTFGQRLWEAMNAPREGGLPSVVSELKDKYGFEVSRVELASIDPPEGWREKTLAPYAAMKEREAAVHKAGASASLLDDTNQALKTWLKTHRNATQAQINAKQEELRQRALARDNNFKEVRNRTDVTGLENAMYASIDGGRSGGVGVFTGGDRGGKGGGGSDDAEGRKTKAADKMFKNKGYYPVWDPQKRTPQGP